MQLNKFKFVALRPVRDLFMQFGQVNPTGLKYTGDDEIPLDNSKLSVLSRVAADDAADEHDE